MVFIQAVSADFHFYLTTPLILYSYHKNKTAGYLIVLVLFLLSFGISFYRSNVFELGPSVIEYYIKPKVWIYIYFNSINRSQVFFIGLVLGLLYLSVVTKNSENKKVSIAYSYSENIGEKFENFCVKITNFKGLRIFFYVFGIFLMIVAAFLPYDLNLHGFDHWPQFWKSLFLSGFRSLFMLGFAFWVFPMLLGHCTGIKSFLSAKIFAITAKMTYSIYLVHFLILFYLLFSEKSIIDMTLSYSGMLIVKVFVYSHVASFFIVTLLEIPIFSLEKHYLGNR